MRGQKKKENERKRKKAGHLLAYSSRSSRARVSREDKKITKRAAVHYSTKEKAGGQGSRGEEDEKRNVRGECLTRSNMSIISREVIRNFGGGWKKKRKREVYDGRAQGGPRRWSSVRLQNVQEKPKRKRLPGEKRIPKGKTKWTLGPNKLPERFAVCED